MLKITRASDAIVIERINIALYGAPGIGKTSLAFTADLPLLLDFDCGAHRAANRKDTVRVQTWSDVAGLDADDLAPYCTVVVDTAGRALDVLTTDIIRRNPKAGRNGALTIQGYGTLKSEFVAWLKQINGYGLDVVLVAHMDEQRNGDEIVERLDVQGGSKGEIYKAADAMGRISIRDGKRMLNFSPTDTAFGKNPGQLEPLAIPHPDKAPNFLAEIVQTIKHRLNALSAEQTKHRDALERWRDTLASMTEVDEFNVALQQVKKEPMAVQSLFAAAAKERGFSYDKQAAKYAAAA